MVEIAMNCFSGLLIRKKKKKTTTTEAAENTKNGSIVHPDVTIPAVDPIIHGEDQLEGAYEGGDEHEDSSSMRREYSDFDLQAKVNGVFDVVLSGHVSEELEDSSDFDLEPKVNREVEVVLNGHVSDPGICQKSNLSSSTRLKRSCSNIETRAATSSHKDLRALTGCEVNGSPLSVNSSFSADWVILRKKSTSQVLPSRSRKLWWRLFLWSHRNLHNTWVASSTTDQNRIPPAPGGDFFKSQKGGYSSETLEQVKGKDDEWVAFSMDYSSSSSPLDRVNAWVNSLEVNVSSSVDFYASETIDFSENLEPGDQARKKGSRRPTEELIKANHVIRSMNPLSTVAHISGMGLKVVPTISAFASLRAVNLSSNAIGQISLGLLPKSLQTLDLSRNRITAIEGLRDLTRLRVLNLSYNKISRIGHGLSNCTLIKELNLAGNKIGHVEGLHRLLKLTTLDLSFNKLTTAKALGQLVANYNSLLVLNLLGNPVQVNVGDDHLRKVVNGLLPRLTFLNKQPVKPQRARDSGLAVSTAALGGASWAERRRPARRTGSGPARLSGGARRKPARR